MRTIERNPGRQRLYVMRLMTEQMRSRIFTSKKGPPSIPAIHPSRMIKAAAVCLPVFRSTFPVRAGITQPLSCDVMLHLPTLKETNQGAGLTQPIRKYRSEMLGVDIKEFRRRRRSVCLAGGEGRVNIGGTMHMRRMIAVDDGWEESEVDFPDMRSLRRNNRKDRGG